MSTLIRTDQVPAADRLDFVREMTAATWVPMECRSEFGDYRGEYRASGLGAMQVVVMDIMPITVRRTPRLISQADPDLLKSLPRTRPGFRTFVAGPGWADVTFGPQIVRLRSLQEATDVISTLASA